MNNDPVRTSGMTADPRLTALEKRVRTMTAISLVAIVLAGVAIVYAIRPPNRLANDAVRVDDQGIHVGDVVAIDGRGIHVRSGKIGLELADTIALFGPEGRIEAGVSGKISLTLSAAPTKGDPIVPMVAINVSAAAASETVQAADSAARIVVGPTTETKLEIQQGQAIGRLIPEATPIPTRIHIPPIGLQ